MDAIGQLREKLASERFAIQKALEKMGVFPAAAKRIAACHSLDGDLLKLLPTPKED